MSGPLEDGIKRWTAQRKSALVIEIIKGKTTVSEASRSYDLAPSEIENWVDAPFLLRSDNGLVFTSCAYTKLVRSYGLKQEFITPHCPQQNGMMERLIRSLKEQCVHRHRFESLAHASRAIGDWIQVYNHKRPHQALAMRTPNEPFKLAA